MSRASHPDRSVWLPRSSVRPPDGAGGVRLTAAVLGGLLCLLPTPGSAQDGAALDCPWADGRCDRGSGSGGMDTRVAPREGGSSAAGGVGAGGVGAGGVAPDASPASDASTIPPAPGSGADLAVPPPPPGSSYAVDASAAPGGVVSGRAGLLLPSTSGLRLPSTISTRMRALEADLQALALRGSGYIIDGVIQLLSSGVSIAVGVLFATSGGASNDAFSAYLFTMGGVGVARGLLTLLVPVTPSESAVAYAHPMPLNSYAEARARLRSREGELEGLATAGMVGRVIDGSLGVGVGLAMIPIFVAVGEFDTENPLNYVMLLLAGVSTVTGVITLFSTSDAERRWNNYRELRDRLQVTAAGAEDERWLEEHADEDEMGLLELERDRGLDYAVNVGIGGGSLTLTF